MSSHSSQVRIDSVREKSPSTSHREVCYEHLSALKQRVLPRVHEEVVHEQRDIHVNLRDIDNILVTSRKLSAIKSHLRTSRQAPANAVPHAFSAQNQSMESYRTNWNYSNFVPNHALLHDSIASLASNSNKNVQQQVLPQRASAGNANTNTNTNNINNQRKPQGDNNASSGQVPQSGGGGGGNDVVVNAYPLNDQDFSKLFWNLNREKEQVHKLRLLPLQRQEEELRRLSAQKKTVVRYHRYKIPNGDEDEGGNGVRRAQNASFFTRRYASPGAAPVWTTAAAVRTHTNNNHNNYNFNNLNNNGALLNRSIDNAYAVVVHTHRNTANSGDSPLRTQAPHARNFSPFVSDQRNTLLSMKNEANRVSVARQQLDNSIYTFVMPERVLSRTRTAASPAPVPQAVSAYRYDEHSSQGEQ